MELVFDAKKMHDCGCNGIAAAFFEDGLSGGDFDAADKLTFGALRAAVSAKEFTGKTGSLLVLRAGEKRVIIGGLGPVKDATLESVRKVFGPASTTLRDAGCAEIAFALPSGVKAPANEVAQACVEAAVLALYKFDKYQQAEPNVSKREVKGIRVLGSEGHRSAVQEGIRVARILGEAANYTRSINNEPPNVATPTFLAEEAKKLSLSKKFTYKVYDVPALKKLGANAILAVGGGSANPPVLVHMEYDGRKGGKGKTVAVVGKGVTFDSGGISIKPSAKMDEMKFDKSGACAVLGIMKAASELALPVKVIGVFASVENLPSGSSYRPADLVKTLSGKTIEVLNTDAEGRVILSDALAYAAREKPDSIIDLATLTGACVVALGDCASGLMGNNESLIERVRAAGESTGERVWPLPLWLEYDEKVKSEVADVKNIGEPGNAGAQSGGSFLKAFVGEIPWAHVDIAGTAWTVKPKAYLGLGATGVGVRMVTDFLMKESKR